MSRSVIIKDDKLFGNLIHKDENAIACYWNIKENRANMIDEPQQLYDMFESYANQNINYKYTTSKKYEGHNITMIIFQHEQEEANPLDVLMFNVSYHVRGFAILLFDTFCFNCKSRCKTHKCSGYYKLL